MPHTIKRIVVIDFPLPKKVKTSYLFTSNFVKIMLHIAEIYVISDNLQEDQFKNLLEIKPINVPTHFLHDIHPRVLSILILGIKYLLIQIKICIHILKLAKRIDYAIFFMMPHIAELMPLLLIKVLRKRSIIVPLGLPLKTKTYASFLYSSFQTLSLTLADYYIPEYETTSEKLKKTIKFPNKILTAAHFFILESSFKETIPYAHREKIVGYIGGFRKIKGIINLAKAIDYVLKRDDQIKFIITGDGILKEDVTKLISSYPKNRVILNDWLPHEDLPLLINKLRLLIVPSYSEGVPNIAIESMACGTPVLSTRVGVIPSLIIDTWNGFILEENSPEYIGQKILEVFSYDLSNLQIVSKNARSTIAHEYIFSNIVNKWTQILSRNL